MGGRGDGSALERGDLERRDLERGAPDRSPLPPVPARAESPRAAAVPAAREVAALRRRGWLLAGLALAAVATAAVFVTDDPLYLRIALLAVCGAFVVAAFLAGGQRTDQVVATRTAQLQHTHDLELERQVAVRHEHEAELESRLRRETEQAMRSELASLRSELAGLSGLRDDLAAVAALRTDLAGLGQLRAELAALGELRTDLGRMRSELTEQLSGELLIERMVMRAQSVRGPASQGVGEGRTLDATRSWTAQSGAGWDVDRQVFSAEPAPRPVEEPQPSGAPGTAAEDVVEAPSPVGWPVDQSRTDADDQPTGAIPIVEPEPRRHRRAAEPDAVAEPDDGAENAVAAEPVAAVPAAVERPSYDSSRYDDMLFSGPSSSPEPSEELPVRREPAHRSSTEPEPAAGPPLQGHARLEQILAESGVQAPSGGRSRRRRYRDEDGENAGDDVLARVLGRS